MATAADKGCCVSAEARARIADAAEIPASPLRCHSDTDTLQGNSS